MFLLNEDTILGKTFGSYRDIYHADTEHSGDAAENVHIHIWWIRVTGAMLLSDNQLVIVTEASPSTHSPQTSRREQSFRPR